MGHARKLEPPAEDESESGLRDALDLLIADDDDPDDMDDTEETLVEYLSQLVRETETVDSDTLGATSRMRAYPLNKTSWTQRVLRWFKR